MEDWQRQLQAKNAQLLRSSLHDPLTGLANRAAFRNALAELMKMKWITRPQRYCFSMAITSN
jgi:PleD family two-component response regulator